MTILPASQLTSDDLTRASRSDTPSEHRRRQLASVLLSDGWGSR